MLKPSKSRNQDIITCLKLKNNRNLEDDIFTIFLEVIELFWFDFISPLFGVTPALILSFDF